MFYGQHDANLTFKWSTTGLKPVFLFIDGLLYEG